VFGKLHLVTRTIEGWDASWCFHQLPRRQLKSIMSATTRGRTYKAPHKASWPPAVESLTSTLWHGGGILSNFGLTTFVATPDCKSLSGWIQRRVTPSELLIAYDMPVDKQTHLDKSWRDNFLFTLLGRPPACVLRMLADAVVSLLDPKTPSFTGGGS
jgi:hypothetical protein